MDKKYYKAVKIGILPPGDLHPWVRESKTHGRHGYKNLWSEGGFLFGGLDYDSPQPIRQSHERAIEVLSLPNMVCIYSWKIVK